MLLGKVTGSLWATRKDEKLNGSKFMLVKTWNMNLEQAEGLLVAADNAGAGVGDLVLITQGMAARISAENEGIPIDAMIVGVVDSVETNNSGSDENEYKSNNYVYHGCLHYHWCGRSCNRWEVRIRGAV